MRWAKQGHMRSDGMRTCRDCRGFHELSTVQRCFAGGRQKNSKRGGCKDLCGGKPWQGQVLRSVFKQSI